MGTETIKDDIGDGGSVGFSSYGFLVLMLIAVFVLTATLAGCTTPAVRLAVPPGWQDRAAPVAAPVIPPATTPCSFDPKILCNSDEELGRTLGDYDAALAEANRKLGWFMSFFGTVPKPKP